MNGTPRLGVDIGRVIIAGPGTSGSADTAFFTGDEATMLATPEISGAVDAIGRLMTRFDGRVWLVSKCGRRVQDRTLRWLDAHDFYTRTGLPSTHVRFCRQRPEKRNHCLALALTHFVDDRADVHEAIRGAVRCQYLFGPGPAPDGVAATPTWADVERKIIASLAGARPAAPRPLWAKREPEQRHPATG